MSSIGKQLAWGGAMMAGGLAIANLLKAPIEEAKKLSQAKADFMTLNLGQIESEKAFSVASVNAHKNLGMSITENIKLIQDLHTATGDLHHALTLNDPFSKFAIAARIANNGKSVDGLVMNAAKALEHRGDKVMQNNSAFNDELDRMSKVHFATKGRVSPNDFFHASQTGKLAYSLFDKEYLYGPFSAYMSAKTGPTAGTAAMSYVSALIGGHMDNKAKGFLARLGLLQVGVSKEQVNLIKEAVAGLHLSQKDSKKLLGAMMPVTGGIAEQYISLAAKRPDIFLADIVAPRMRKVINPNITNEEIAETFMRYFNRNTADFMGEHFINSVKFKKDTDIFNKTMGFSAAYQNYLKSPEGAELAAGEAWKNFLALIGSVYLPVVTQGLEKLATWLDVAGQYVEKNGETVKAYAYGLAGLSAFLIGGGLINLIAGAGRGFALLFTVLSGGGGVTGAIMKGIGFIGNLIMIGIRAIPIIGWILMIATAAVWVYRNWDFVAAKAKQVWGFIGPYITGIWDNISDFAKTAWGVLSTGFKGFIGFFLDQWQWAFNNLIDMVNAFLPRVAQLNRFDFADRWNRTEASYSNEGHGHSVPVPPKQPITINIAPQAINIDSKKVAEVVTAQQTREATKPMTGMRGFDAVSSVVLPTMPSSFYPRG